jgi:hypothetical protein
MVMRLDVRSVWRMLRPAVFEVGRSRWQPFDGRLRAAAGRTNSSGLVVVFGVNGPLW